MDCSRLFHTISTVFLFDLVEGGEEKNPAPFFFISQWYADVCNYVSTYIYI